MENTIENKARFFSLYYGTETLSVFKALNYINYNTLDSTAVRLGYLELKPLSLITDKERHMLMDIKANEEEDDEYLALHSADYLRSKGYAMPFMGLSVETMIEYGWIKLKTK